MKFKNNKNNLLKTSIFSLVFCLISYCSTALAVEYVYISDQLRVGVRTDPTTDNLPIGVVSTGMRLEVEDRSDGYVKIKTEKGMSGWIKDIYVTNNAPAVIQLKNLQASYSKLKKELAQENETSAVLEKANAALNEQVDELKKDRREWQRQRALAMASPGNDGAWLWYILFILLFGGSFAGGAAWYRTRAMKKLGGLRV